MDRRQLILGGLAAVVALAVPTVLYESGQDRGRARDNNDTRPKVVLTHAIYQGGDKISLHKTATIDHLLQELAQSRHIEYTDDMFADRKDPVYIISIAHSTTQEERGRFSIFYSHMNPEATLSRFFAEDLASHLNKRIWCPDMTRDATGDAVMTASHNGVYATEALGFLRAWSVPTIALDIASPQSCTGAEMQLAYAIDDTVWNQLGYVKIPAHNLEISW